MRHNGMPKLFVICQEEVQYFLVIFEMGVDEHKQSALTYILFRYWSILFRKNKRKHENTDPPELLVAIPKHYRQWLMHKDMQGVFMQIMRNDDNGNN